MKKLLFALLFLPLLGYAQADSLLNTLPQKDGRVYYSGVVEVIGVGKAELYNRAKRWAVDAYKSAKDVIQLDDPENGDLVLKGNFKTYWQSTFMTGQEVRVNHTIRLSVKDGKYRYEITDFVANGYNESTRYSSGGPWELSLEEFAKGRPQNSKKFFKQSVVPRVVAMIESINAGMLKPIAKSDW